MGIVILFLIILPAILLIWGILCILAAKYNWTIILIIRERPLIPFDMTLGFGKKFVKDEALSRKLCMIEGIISIVIVVVFLSFFLLSLWLTH